MFIKYTGGKQLLEKKKFMDSENFVINKNEEEQATQESIKSVEPIAETNGHDEIIKKLKDAEEKAAKLEQTVNSKTDFIKLLEHQKINSEKELVQLKKERENAVIRYVTVEKSLLDAKNLGQNFEKKVKDLQREIELLNGKIKQGASDKTRICGILDDKCHELRLSQREIEKLKYEHTGLDTKLKWHAQKALQETEARMKAEKRIDELTAEINKLKLSEINRAKDELEIERNMLAEKQLVEVNANMILIKHDNEEKTRKIEGLERKCHHLEAELDSLSSKYSNLNKEHDETIKDVASLRQQNDDCQCLLDKQTLKIAELQSNQNDLEIIKTQFSLEKESNRQFKNEISLLTAQIDEQNEETEKWKANEMELLQLNKELTETVVKLKNECSTSNSKALTMSVENEMIKKDKSYYENIISDLKNQLDEDIKKRNSDCQLMAKHISEKTKTIENLQRKVEELSGELEAQGKKNSHTVKELTREISQLTKKLDSNSNRSEKKSPTPSTASESSTESQHNEYPTLSFEPSQKSLIDRIVRLQNEIVRKSEKIDFLENHQAQLVEELKKKSKLLHHYLLREQAGQLLKSRKVPDTTNMTFELAIEVNRKLQNTLEDTILKNITLKENLDQLSQEVDRMKRIAAATSNKK
ncbi:hypothetical protein ACKWTF_013810 [Chironomus riparius]